jgi:aerobic carbon-monoxide dehydrogenase small subunit
MHEVELQVNGQRVRRSVASTVTLVEFLREELRLTGTHVGCDTVQCGACTVLVDGRSVKACNVLVVQVAGREVRTIESLATGEVLHPMQQAFANHHGLQCGFCTPGMVMRGIAMAHEGVPATGECIRRNLCGNLCRCTGYEGIVLAIGEGMEAMRRDKAHAGV